MAATEALQKDAVTWLTCRRACSVQMHRQVEGLRATSTWCRALSTTTAFCCSSCSSASYRLRLVLIRLCGLVVTSSGWSCDCSAAPAHYVAQHGCMACVKRALYYVLTNVSLAIVGTITSELSMYSACVWPGLTRQARTMCIYI